MLLNIFIPISMSYFLDTSFIMAYTIATDNQHIKTDSLESLILKNNCYITNGVLNECVSVSFNKTKSLAISNEVYYILIDNFNILNEYDIANYNDKTLEIFNNHDGKLSFTDAGIITTMKGNNIDNLISFDKEFKKETSINVIGV